MIIKTIENKENETKFDIYKYEDGTYGYKYYEFFEQCGWRYVSKNRYPYTKEAIEFDFDINLD